MLRSFEPAMDGTKGTENTQTHTNVKFVGPQK